MTLHALLAQTHDRVNTLGPGVRDALMREAHPHLIIDDAFLEKAQGAHIPVLKILEERVRAGLAPFVDIEKVHPMIEDHIGQSLSSSLACRLALRGSPLLAIKDDSFTIETGHLHPPQLSAGETTAAEFDQRLEQAFDIYKKLPPHIKNIRLLSPNAEEAFDASDLPHRAAVLKAGIRLFPSLFADPDLEVRKTFEVAEQLPAIADRVKEFIVSEIEEGRAPHFFCGHIPYSAALETAHLALGLKSRIESGWRILCALRDVKSHNDGFWIEIPSLKHATEFPVQIQTSARPGKKMNHNLPAEIFALHEKLGALLAEQEAQRQARSEGFTAEGLFLAQTREVRAFIETTEEDLLDMARSGRIPHLHLKAEFSADDRAYMGFPADPTRTGYITIGQVFSQYMKLKHGVRAHLRDRIDLYGKDGMPLCEPVRREDLRPFIAAWIDLAQ